MSKSDYKTRVKLLHSLVKTAGETRRLERIARIVETGTRVDVGSWIGKRRVWVCVLESELLLIAKGPRSYVQSIPFASLKDSLYNHVTGELVLGPAEDVRVTRLRMPPLDAVKMLACIGVPATSVPGEPAVSA